MLKLLKKKIPNYLRHFCHLSNPTKLYISTNTFNNADKTLIINGLFSKQNIIWWFGRRAFYLLLLSSTVITCSAQALPTDTISLELYNQTVDIIRKGKVQADINFLFIATDESSDISTDLVRAITRSGARLTVIKFHTSDLVKLTGPGEIFKFNTRHMFTSRGLYASLLAEGSFSNQEVLDSVGVLSRKILNLYFGKKNKPLLITLNNALSKSSQVSFLNSYFKPDSDPENYILVTEKLCYTYLKKNKINTILQKKDINDDGSLLSYSIQNDLPYIEINGKGGQSALKLIATINRMIEKLYPGYINR